MKTYKIGVSFKGLACFLLVMVPNFFWMAWPPAGNTLAANDAANPMLDALLNICRWVLIALLVLLVNTSPQTAGRARLFLVLGALCLLGYYVAWALYYAGNRNSWLFVLGLAAAPSLFFIFAALWLKNIPALVPAAVFALIHVGVTCSNYL